MNTAESTLDMATELRVLQGPQAGCRLALAPGKVYTLGSSDECSVVLAGPQIQPRHAQLVSHGDLVEITALDGTVTIDGTDLVATSETWELGSVFLLGRLALCVDLADTPWPTEAEIVASMAYAQEGSPDEASDSAFDDEDAEPDEDARLEADDEDEVDPRLPSTVNPAGAGDADGTPRQPSAGVPSGSRGPDQRRAFRRVLIGCSVVLAGSTTTLVWMGLSHPASLAAATPTTIGVGGFLPTTGQADKAPTARAEVDAVTPPSPQAAAARLDALVQELRIPDRQWARWTQEGDGAHIRIAMADASGASALRERVLALQPETGPVQLEVLGPADIAGLFRAALESSGLAQRFMSDPMDPAPLSFRATLTPQEVSRWERTFLSFTERFGNVPPIRVQVVTDADRLDHQIGSVVGGNFPYIVTPQGQRIAPGGQLMGRTVASVQTGEVVFADGVRYRFIQ